MNERPIIWKPNAGPQTAYLMASEEELLYGGAAGGGKTDALVIDALGLWQGAIEHADYRAIVFRKTFPELRKVIDRCNELYPQIVPGAKYNATEHVWSFPSGAQIIHGFAESDTDKYKYQGQEFQFIGWEELTQWPTDSIYKYLFSRLRTANPKLKCLVRSTTNPGGVGHEWVRERWSIDDMGHDTKQDIIMDLSLPDGTTERRTMRRRFIQAKLEDNPYLGSDYRASLMELDDNDRKALLDGRWDIVDIPGQIYKEELQRSYSEGRIMSVPYDEAAQVHTVWDLGMSDAMSIGFFQAAGFEWHMIDYYEASGEGLGHYAKVLSDKPYSYGKHYAPHDIEVREIGSGMSRKESGRKLGINFEPVPNLLVADGIDALRSIFSRIYFDQTKCKRILDCLRHYRRDYNDKMGQFKAEPVHDWASHGSDMMRYFAVTSKMLNQSANTGRSTTIEGKAGRYNTRVMA